MKEKSKRPHIVIDGVEVPLMTHAERLAAIKAKYETPEMKAALDELVYLKYPSEHDE